MNRIRAGRVRPTPLNVATLWLFAMLVAACPADEDPADAAADAGSDLDDLGIDLRTSDVPDTIFFDSAPDIDDETACVPECEPGTALCSGSSRISYCDDSSGCPFRASPVPCPEGQGCRDGVCGEVCVDRDGDGYTIDCDSPPDCDDERSDVNPGAPEECDERDNNCDRRVDENFVCERACVDECEAGTRLCAASGRGYVTCESPAVGCRRWSGTIPCDEGELCQGGSCVDEPTCDDRDGDAHGPACGEGMESDCRPYDASSYPGANERCDGVDNDCDGEVDEGDVCASSCPRSGPRSPYPQVAGVAYGAGCGEVEYADAPEVSAGARVLAVVMAEGPVSANLGGLSGADFVEGVAFEPLGLGAMAVVDGPLTTGSVLQVDTDADAWWLATTPELAGDEAFEPNDAPAAAAPLGTVPAALAGEVSAGDRDYYAFDVPAGSVVAASLAYEGSSDVGVTFVMLRNGVQVAPTFAGVARESGFLDGAHTFFRLDAPGEYALGVSLSAGSATVPYALALRAFADACDDDDGDDAASTDDLLTAARPLAVGDTVEAVLCPGDFDIYDLGDLSSGDFVSAELAISGAGELDGRMLRESWAGLVQERSDDGASETFANNISRAGRHYLVIHGRSALDGGAYTLTRSAE